MVEISPAEALRLVALGACTGVCRNQRVKSLRMIDARRPNPAADAYDVYWHKLHTCRRFDGQVTRHTVEIWDRYFERKKATA